MDPLLSSAAFGGAGATPSAKVALGIGWPSFDAPLKVLAFLAAACTVCTKPMGRDDVAHPVLY